MDPTKDLGVLMGEADAMAFGADDGIFEGVALGELLCLLDKDVGEADGDLDGTPLGSRLGGDDRPAFHLACYLRLNWSLLIVASGRC